MSGINGVWSINQKIDLNQFNKMRDELTHRGPDDADTWLGENDNIALGNRDLNLEYFNYQHKSIFFNKSVVITGDCDIDNLDELKIELESLGHKFRTNFYLEVLVKAWKQWKTDLPKYLKGNFALAIWDNIDKTLFLARDRFGTKPLYFHSSEHEFIFASELKALISWKPELKNINFSAFADYFTYRYIPSPCTIYEKVYKLPPAYCMIVDSNLVMKQWQYWDLAGIDIKCREKDVEQIVSELLNKSLQNKTNIKTPIGSLLSGGYDSSAIVCLFSEKNYKFNTFSIGFDNWQGSEHEYAKIVADHCGQKLYSKVLDEGSLSVLHKLVHYYDEPIADISIIPSYFVFQMASELNKTVLSGDGADEIFAGYTWHAENMNLLYSGFLSSIFKIQNKKAFSVEEYSKAMAMGHLRRSELLNLMSDDLHAKIPIESDWFYKQHYVQSLPNLKRFQYLDIKTFMSELILTKVDRASMANSVQVKTPFLDHELVEFLFSAPVKKVFNKHQTKQVLYNLIKDKLPYQILQRKKQGFVGPDSYYFNSRFYQNIINDSKLIKDQIL
ncbi:MAG: asparagine synthase (glutamine-hydrolyzing), partial [Bacteroidales bacterium]|nr:asparagine synthase (glutamine-hydrolyzing) [Bacteroidales bacterium]